MNQFKPLFHNDQAPFRNEMKYLINRLILKLLLIFLCLTTAWLSHYSPVLAQAIEVTVNDDTGGTSPPTIYPSTGTAPFSSTCTITPTAGEDCSSEDDFVRTFDTITYQVNYSVNPAGTTAENAKIACTLSSGTPGGDGQPVLEWHSGLIPPQCTNGSNAISADGLTLTCEFGDLTGGQAANFKPTARVLGNALNGQQLDMSCTMDADNETNTGEAETSTETVSNFVSASPKLDLLKYRTTSILRRDVEHDYDGDGDLDPGLVYRYYIRFIVGGGKGSEMITEDLVFTDTFTYRTGNNAGQLVPGVILETTNSNANPCVISSGTITCTQSGPGQPVSINISGADTTGQNVSSSNPYVLTGYLGFWIPLDKINDGQDGIPGNNDDSRLAVNNTYSAIDPNGISGESNYGDDVEPIGNNNYPHWLYTYSGSMDKYYIRNIEPASTYPVFSHITGRTATGGYVRQGDGRVMPEQEYGSMIYHTSSGGVDLPAITLCDKVDNITQFATNRSTDSTYPPLELV